MSPIIIAIALVVALGTVLVVVRTRNGTLRDWRIYLIIGLCVVGVWGSYGGSGRPWPGGPDVGYDVQVAMVLAGLVATIAAIILSVAVARHPRRSMGRLAEGARTDAG